MSQDSQSENTVITAARQTMAAWSKVIESREDIPSVYRNLFDRHFDTRQHFPYVILTPPLDKFLRKTTEKLVCDTDDAIYVFERDGNQIDASRYAYRDVYGVEVGVVLLDAWLTISGKTSAGEAGLSTIEFNTTSLRYFEPILKKMRPAPRPVDKAVLAAERDKFDSLATANFKFMNYGRESLIPGETVLQILLQPEIRQSLLTVFGKTFYKTLSPAHLTVVTDRELILIRDVERGRKATDRYGGVWQYMPLHRLDSVNLSDAANDRLTLSIHCQPGRTIEKLFESSS
ncbi:MAG: hypothetical protein WCC12_02365, partial [Anaerolineales bacterium]